MTEPNTPESAAVSVPLAPVAPAPVAEETLPPPPRAFYPFTADRIVVEPHVVNGETLCRLVTYETGNVAGIELSEEEAQALSIAIRDLYR